MRAASECFGIFLLAASSPPCDAASPFITRCRMGYIFMSAYASVHLRAAHTHNMKVEHFWMTQLPLLKPQALKGTVSVTFLKVTWGLVNDHRVFTFWVNSPFKCMWQTTPYISYMAVRNGVDSGRHFATQGILVPRKLL